MIFIALKCLILVWLLLAQEAPYSTELVAENLLREVTEEKRKQSNDLERQVKLLSVPEHYEVVEVQYPALVDSLPYCLRSI